MKFESVRLIHAQTVPNHYLTNQIYQPVDDDHKQRGSFIILFDQENGNNGAFVASLINMLIREYYRQSDPDRLSCFESTLVRLNDQIKHFTHQKDAHTLSLHGAIVLVIDNELHITTIGQPLGFLQRKEDLIPLVDGQKEDEESSRGFSVITSGEIHLDDHLILLTPLQSDSTIKQDLSFALSHNPLQESARALALIFKQKFERSAEGILIHFNEETDTTSQLYVDKTLVSPTEKMSQFQQQLAKHGALVFSGVEFISKRAHKDGKGIASLTSQLSTKLNNKTQESDNLDLESPDSEVVTESSPVLSPVSVEENESDSPTDYQVRTFRSAQTEPLPIMEPKSEPKPHHDTISLSSPATNLRRISIKPRTVYLLLAAIVGLIIFVRVVNIFVSQKPQAKSENQTIAQRDEVINQATEFARAAEAAQVKDDLTTAIDQLLLAQEKLGTITEKNQNEASKALAGRVNQSLTNLTKTVSLEKPTSRTLSGVPQKVIAAPTVTFVLPKELGVIEKYSNDMVTPMNDFPSGASVVDATLAEKGQKLAVFTTKDSTPGITTVSLADDTSKSIERADGKAWPLARLITSYDVNLYLVGNEMTKAIPKDDKFRVVPYGSNLKTDTVQSIVNNGFAFYGLENNKLVRIDAKSGKTPVSFFGVPERFLPKKMNRLLSTAKEGQLYIVDITAKRILVFSTDGGYRKQFTLAGNDDFIDCDTNDTHFYCITPNKELKIFAIPQ